MEKQSLGDSLKKWGRVTRWFLPNGGTLLMMLALILTVNVWARPFAAPQMQVSGQMPVTMHYQGRLYDNAGAPLSTSVGMRFTIYDALTGGNVMWGPEIYDTVMVQDGLFDVALGSQIPMSPALWNGDRYLEIAVDGQVLSPRELIRSVPYAQMAGMALALPDGAIDSHNVHLTNGQVKAEGTSSITLGADLQTIPGTIITLTLEMPATFLFYVTADFDVTDALALGVLAVDGDATGREELHFKATNAGRATVSQTYLVTLNAGQHTVALQAKRYSGTTAKIYGTHTIITYFAIAP